MKPQILRGLRFLFSLVVACGPAGAPGAGGPGRCVCRWAAARPRAVRAASFARRVASKPGQAPPPPTGTAADPSGVLYTCGAGSLFGSSTRRLEARPGPATAHGNRSLARLFLWVSWGSRVLSFWGARVRVVTNVVNPRCFSCGFLLRCYERRQSEGFFAEVPVEGLCWASFFAEMPLKGPCWAIFSRQSALRPGLVGDVAHEAGCGGGFAALEAGWRRVAGVSYL